MLQHRLLKDHVYDYISAQINSGAITPNKKINENALCEALGTSRTPVREALMQLAHEGYIEQIPRRGFVVRDIDEARAREIYEILGCLEAKAAERAVNLVTPSEMGQLKDLVAQMDSLIRAHRYEDYYQVQLQFHEAFNDAGKSHELSALIKHLKRTFLRQRYNPKSPESDFEKTLLNTNEGHRTMLRLLESRQSQELKDYLEKVHWNFGYAELETFE